MCPTFYTDGNFLTLHWIPGYPRSGPGSTLVSSWSIFFFLENRSGRGRSPFFVFHLSY